MGNEFIIDFIIQNPICYDRFTFDKYMRLLLSTGFTYEESKSFILNNCKLSTLVYQERIQNKSYLKITQSLSKDLADLKNEILKNMFLNYN